MITIGESISRVRNVLKAVKEDPFLTDRFIYSVIIKYAKMLIRRQDNESKIMRFQSLFDVLPCVELIEVSKIEACCTGVKTNCKIMRTKDKLPQLLEGAYGPLFRSVTSIDGSIEMFKTYPATYTAMSHTTNFKYNKTKYFWYLNGYLYFPNIEWEAVRVEGLWDEDVSKYTCEVEVCTPRQDQSLRIPEYLFGEIEQMALKEILTAGQIPTDGPDDKQNILR
jgi:hypothetical protein